MKNPQIFLSYRRDSAAGYAGRLYDNLTTQMSADVFMDVDAIPPGADFAGYIGEAVGGCDVLLALIDADWVTAEDAQGRRRLDSPRDFVRTEIAAALERRIPVIPLLVHGAAMPRREEVPDVLAPLTERQALELDNNQWKAGVTRLVERLKHLSPSNGNTGAPPKLELHPSSIDFGTVTVADPWPRRTVQLRNAGGGELAATTTTTEPWIVLRNRGSALDVLVDTSYPGDYTGRINVTSKGGDASIVVHAAIASAAPPPGGARPGSSSGTPGGSGGSGASAFVHLVPTHLVRSIVATLLFAPAGIVALVFAAQVNGKKSTGDVDGAVRASRRAKRWCWVAFGAALVLFVLGFLSAIAPEPSYDPYYGY